MVTAIPTLDLAQLSLGDLIRVASAQPILDEGDEHTLIERARSGDGVAREQLVMVNLRVVIDEAIRTRGWGLPQRKLVPLGVSSLLDAIRTYDPASDGAFSSYVRARVRIALRHGTSVS